MPNAARESSPSRRARCERLFRQPRCASGQPFAGKPKSAPSFTRALFSSGSILFSGILRSHIFPHPVFGKMWERLLAAQANSIRRNRRTPAGKVFPPSQPPRTAHPLTASPRRCRSHLRQLRRAAIGFPYSVSTSSESRPRMTRVPCPGDDSISIVCPRRARMRLHRYSPMPVARRSPSRPLKPV